VEQERQPLQVRAAVQALQPLEQAEAALQQRQAEAPQRRASRQPEQ